MVLESANCTDCKSEIWHYDNYCQECGVRTSFMAQRDSQWREAPAGPSWIREPMDNKEPMAPSWQKPAEPSWNGPVESKPVEPQVVESKAIESKPAEPKLVWPKPVESKPVESKTFETKPVEPKPAEIPVEIKPAQPKSLEQPKSGETSWNQPVEPTPIRSFVQSTSSSKLSPLSEPAPSAVSPAPPPPPPSPVWPTEAKDAPAVKAPSAPVVPVMPPAPVMPPVQPVQKPVAPAPEMKNEIPETKLVESPKAETKPEDTVLKARWTPLESPLLRPRSLDEVEERRPPEEVVHKIKITNILWLCVCFLAGILIYCLFDIVKMTMLKPETAVQPAAVVPMQTKPAEIPAKPAEVPQVQPVVESTPIEQPAAAVMPVKAVSVQSPITVKPVAAPKPVVKVPPVAKPAVKPVPTATIKAAATVKPQPVKPVTKPAPVKPPAKAKAIQSFATPEVVQPAESTNSSRTRTVWQAPTSAVKANSTSAGQASVAQTQSKSTHVVAGKGTGGDLARYNRLLADYFSRAGNGSFGDESSEPPTYSEWLSRGKPEF